MRTLLQWPPVRLVREVLERGASDDVGTATAALTYQALWSLVPLLLLASSIVGFLTAGDPEEAAELQGTIEGAVPGLGDVMAESLVALADARLAAGTIALLSLGWTGSSLALAASQALGRILRTPPRALVRRRADAFVALALGGSVFLVALVATTATSGLSNSWLLRLTASYVVALGSLALVYRILTPRGGPSLREHVPGAAVAAGLWLAIDLLGGWYADQVVARLSVIYGTIGVVFGLLVTLSFASRGFLYGAELTAVLRERSASREM